MIKVRKTYYLHPSIIKQIKQYAFFNDMKISEVIHEMAVFFLKRKAKK